MNISLHSNLLAQTAGDILNLNNRKQIKSSERLSSGYRINKSADDAAGLAISEKMRRQIRGLSQGAKNIQDGIGFLQVGEGALNEVHDMLHRINELAVKSANDTNSNEDREYIDSEVQALKKEMDRVFETTTFNDKNIWEINNKKVIGVEPKQAVTIPSSYSSIIINNDNCGVVAVNGYKINADDNGINISWTGYNGDNYVTDTIDWDTLEQNNYTFEMSDYFGDTPPNDKLYANGNPLIKFRVKFNPIEDATREDMIYCLNGRTMSSGVGASMNLSFENGSGNAVNYDGIRISSYSTYYQAMFASNHDTGTNGNKNDYGDGYKHDFNSADDIYLTPMDANNHLQGDASYNGNLISGPGNGISYEDAKTSSDGWEFKFFMGGIGSVTASSTKVEYWSNDRDPDSEGLWWGWNGAWITPTQYDPHYSKSTYSRNSNQFGNGTLGDVMDCLTGDESSKTPGLLKNDIDMIDPDKNGVANTGGTIRLYFDVKSDENYTYGSGSTGKEIGSFYVDITVKSDDTVDTVLNRINNAFQENTPSFNIDISSSSRSSHAYIYNANPNTKKIDSKIYGGDCLLYIHAGPEKDDGIDIVYDHMSLRELGVFNTETKTRESSLQAIEDVKNALRLVSEERTVFGAYQNRLEHAYNNNKNVEENTQAAESQIRDTDMAKTMVEHANTTILMQVGQAMLTQAKQQPETILTLLQ